MQAVIRANKAVFAIQCLNSLSLEQLSNFFCKFNYVGNCQLIYGAPYYCKNIKLTQNFTMQTLSNALSIVK